MTELEDVRIHLAALKKALAGFDDIYGLDDDHVELLEYQVSERKVGSEIKKYQIKMLIECNSKTNSEVIVAGITKSLVNVDINNVKFSLLSGSLHSLRFSAFCDYPLLLLREHLEIVFKELEAHSILDSSSVVLLAKE